ncbi:DUF885 domain-containing protein [Streptomyces rhizosphaerihabitans]|uniref:DUF885 domain-containing protein n=1 Tax=Streptomyces rhizosphaerihabitans TaxID=1266770 RepID=UPI0021C13841|nr:DUF885 domain-containing protein [Streptomyces rhizosphaerihabitans]MCT9008469.1 DUF885 domain-containing protein [Streptomyces rhizosphaerihabitans]
MAEPGDRRVRAALDLDFARAREYVGAHTYDARVQDLSPAGVAAALARLGIGPLPGDAFDAAVTETHEEGLRIRFAEVQVHRRDPLLHVAAMDLACYDREYAPFEERRRARERHLALWPDAVDNALEALDRVSAPVATASLPAVRGLASGVREPGALAAVRRLTAHVEKAARDGDPSAALGSDLFLRLLGAGEGVAFDLTELTETAERERARLRALLAEAVERHAPGERPADVVPALLRDHPDTAEGVFKEASALIGEITAFTVGRNLIGDPGGVCEVGPAPPSRAFAQAMMSWSAPYEPDAPSWYYVVPPDPAWSAEEAADWLAVFSRTSLPAITVHEVTPGHYAHGRALRALTSDVRRSLESPAFVEGWAHYTEELLVEECFRAGDPLYVIGTAVEALLRVTRLACSIGLHTGALSVADAASRFEEDAFLRGTAAIGEAGRGTVEATYGRYTLGKLEIRRVRRLARQSWGDSYTHRRFHDALLGLGMPPIGLIERAVVGDLAS